MPSLEIICIGQSTPCDFSQLPFTVKAEKELVSHRLPNPLFQSDFGKSSGYIYHILDSCEPMCFTCYHLLKRDWYDEHGNDNGLDENIEFREEYEASMIQMLEELLLASPVSQILFTTDYQFGPEVAQRNEVISFATFKELYNAGKVRMNASYLISAI